MDQPLATKDGESIAAWLLKANPDVFDIEAEIEAYGVITDWSLSARPTYRVPLMAAGQRCFLFQTAGADGKGFTGIIAVGEVVGEPLVQVSGNTELWKDQERAAEAVPYVPLELLPLETPIPRADMVALPQLAEMEVFRSPQMSNPVVIRQEELAALESFGLGVVEPSEEQFARLAE